MYDSDPQQSYRDHLKDEVCRKLGLHLLRINANSLAQVGPYTTVGWLCEMWFQARAFCYARDRGEIDPDTPLVSCGFIEDKCLCLNAQAYPVFNQAFSDGHTETCFPDEGWGWRKGDRYARAYSVLRLTHGGAIVGAGSCMAFDFPPTSPSIVARLVASADCGRKVESFRQGEYVPWSEEMVAHLRRQTRDWEWNDGFRPGSRSGPLPSGDFFFL
jgi:hypothetical protein